MKIVLIIGLIAIAATHYYAFALRNLPTVDETGEY